MEFPPLINGSHAECRNWKTYNGRMPLSHNYRHYGKRFSSVRAYRSHGNRTMCLEAACGVIQWLYEVIAYDRVGDCEKDIACVRERARRRIIRDIFSRVLEIPRGRSSRVKRIMLLKLIPIADDEQGCSWRHTREYKIPTRNEGTTRVLLSLFSVLYILPITSNTNYIVYEFFFINMKENDTF